MFTLSEAQARFDEIVKDNPTPDAVIQGLTGLFTGHHGWLEAAKLGDEEAQEFAGHLTHFLATAFDEAPDKTAAFAHILTALDDDGDGVRLYLIQNILLSVSPETLAKAQEVVEAKAEEDDIFMHLTGGIIRLQGDPEAFEAYVTAHTETMGDADWFHISELYVTADRPEEALERLDKIVDEEALWPDTAVIRHAAYTLLEDVEKAQALTREFFVKMPIPVAYHMISKSWPTHEEQQAEAERLVGLINQTEALNVAFVSTLLKLEQEERAADYVLTHKDRLVDAGLGLLAEWTDALADAEFFAAALATLTAAMACLDEVDPSQREMVKRHLEERAEVFAAQIPQD